MVLCAHRQSFLKDLHPLPPVVVLGLSSSDQKLVDAQGKEYSADDTATLYAAPDGATSTWYNQINPGNSVNGDIIFDIPTGVTPVTAVLHDSAFSGGVKVNLQ